VITSVIFAVRLRAPLVAVMVSGYVPGAVPLLAVKVSVELPVPVTVLGLNPAVTPEGGVLTENPMLPLNPLSAVVFTV
jgi:hypothetical protein